MSSPARFEAVAAAIRTAIPKADQHGLQLLTPTEAARCLGYDPGGVLVAMAEGSMASGYFSGTDYATARQVAKMSKALAPLGVYVDGLTGYASGVYPVSS